MRLIVTRALTMVVDLVVDLVVNLVVDLVVTESTVRGVAEGSHALLRGRRCGVTRVSTGVKGEGVRHVRHMGFIG